MIAIHNGPSVAASSTRISNANPAVVGLTPGISRSNATATATAPSAATMSTLSRVGGVGTAAQHILTPQRCSPCIRDLLRILYELLMRPNPTSGIEKASCSRSSRSSARRRRSAETASLVADYLAFDRRRTVAPPVSEGVRRNGDHRRCSARCSAGCTGGRRRSSPACCYCPPLALAVDRGRPLASAGSPPRSRRARRSRP